MRTNRAKSCNKCANKKENINNTKSCCLTKYTCLTKISKITHARIQEFFPGGDQASFFFQKQISDNVNVKKRCLHDILKISGRDRSPCPHLWIRACITSC